MRTIDWRGLLQDYGRFVERLPAAANIVLTIALAYLLADLTWRAVPAPAPETPRAVAPSPMPSAVRAPQNEVRRDIANLHLFGEAANDIAAPAEVPISAPETQLRLTLLGVSASQNSTTAWAIIADASGNEETYGIDSALPGGAILKEIHPDRVILMRNNRFETLRLPQESLDTGGARAMANQAPAGQYDRGLMPASVGVSPQTRETLRGYREALVKDPQSVMDVVRAEPYRNGGALQGYRVFPGRDKEILGQLGLRPGDVVTAVNGVALDNPIKGLEIMRDLSSASQVTVDVLRNGASQSLVVPIQ